MLQHQKAVIRPVRLKKSKHMRIYDYMKGILGAMGVGEDVGVPEPSWRIEEYLKAIYDKLKEGGGLPAVTSADNGKVLAVEDGAWAASAQGKKFIVTLTPTALDYSGTMDKTVAEINAAYEAGQQIVFRTMMSETTYMETDCTARWFGNTTYPSFNGFILDSDSNALIFAFTGAMNDGTQQTYSATIFPLTPAS